MKQNAHLTHQGNIPLVRHNWLRLTPAYSVHLVEQELKKLDYPDSVLDPFSGSGTTPLVAAQLGLRGIGCDINPFLIWLGNLKLNDFSDLRSNEIQTFIEEINKIFTELEKNHHILWQPNIHKIERWWNETELATLRIIRKAIDEVGPLVANQMKLCDLANVALCKFLINKSHASFNHQSMSFNDSLVNDNKASLTEIRLYLQEYLQVFREIAASTLIPISGHGEIIYNDAKLSNLTSIRFDALITSPPYVNRMSYIRELRPYMYWMKFLNHSSDAGVLDWKAIGGTWGTASSNLNDWQPIGTSYVDMQLQEVCQNIARSSERNGKLLSKYVQKYFYDMAHHFELVGDMLKQGAKTSYVIGNSTFYGVHVPAHEWYAKALESCGFHDVHIEILRKRNSKKELFEYKVSAIK